MNFGLILYLYKMLRFLSKRLQFFLGICFFCSLTYSQNAKIWEKYTGKNKDGSIPMLFDYSYAGYQLGEKAVPDSFPDLMSFNIEDYGAVANDSLSDQTAIQKAIEAAQKKGGGIVFFPKGRFIVNASDKKTTSINISQSNIILKGSGMGKNGTVVEMKNHMNRAYPEQPEWQVDYMLKFRPTMEDGEVSPIIKNAKEGDFSITVKNGRHFKGEKYIKIEMPYTTDLVNLALQGRKPRPHWKRILKKGVAYIETHEITHIKKNRIFLKSPLVNNINIDHMWTVKPFHPLENVGVEDIFFEGNFKEDFKHHKNYIHDNAWSFISMQGIANSWVRRCRFANTTGAVSFSRACSSSILMLVVEGNSAHKLTNVATSTHVLTGLIRDKTNQGQWHGPSMSHKTCGSVIWRVKTPKRGWDSHADIPQKNLVDLYEGGKMTSHGGNYKNEPHHLEGLTLWNYQKVGDPVTSFDFWKLKGKGIYWGLAVVNPIVVGFHGSETTFNEKSIGYMESLGSKVAPESLYEAQLTKRIGQRPKWVDHCLNEWKNLQKNM